MAIATIVGAGFMGTATAWPLRDNGHEVRLVGTHLDAEIISSCRDRSYHPKLRRPLPAGVIPFFIEQLSDALQGSDLIVSGVNSLGVHWLGRTLASHVGPGTVVLAVTKGLETQQDGTVSILPDILAGEFPAGVRDQVKISAIGGPCIAGELAGRRPTCVVFAGRDAELLQKLRGFFETSYYHIETSTDLIGVEVCAALKNAFVLAVGMAGGLLERSGGVDASGAAMHNTAAALFGLSAREMVRIVALMGGDPEIVACLPGVGDQYVTSAGGRTVRMGQLLGKGLTYPEACREMAGETLEGAYVVQQLGRALPLWEARGVLGREELPLTRMLIRVITENAPVELPFSRRTSQRIFPDMDGQSQ
jgi:glycerol-3-phosphate dehydrogenase (NAD(P)+)